MAINAEIIHGSKVRLRPVIFEDIETIRKWRNKDSIRCWFVNDAPISPEQQLKWWDKYSQATDEIMFMIEVLPQDLPIGAVALYKIILNHTAEFGRLMIGEMNERGKGYALEATVLLTDYGFSRFGLNTIDLEVFPNNNQAIKMYERAGFISKGEAKPKDNLISMFKKN